MMNPFEILKDEDIQEKVDVNITNHGHTLESLRADLQRERAELQRMILRMQAQVQNYNEQIEYIDRKIMEKQHGSISGSN